MAEKSCNGGQEDIYSFKTDSPVGSDSSDLEGKVNGTQMGSVKYKRKLWRNSTDDEDEVPCLKPCIVVLKRSSLCEAAWQKERQLMEKRQKVDSKFFQRNGCAQNHQSNSPVSDADFKCHVCQETFSGRNLYMHHMRAKHGTSNNNIIRQGTPPPPPKGEFLRFYRHKSIWKLDTRNLDCEVCSKAMPSPYKLKEHLEVEHGKTLYMGGPELYSSSEKFPCSLCHKVCETKAILERHFLVKHASHQQQMNDAPQSSQLVQRADEYTNGADRKVKVYECPYCFTLHANKDRFKKHLGFVQYPYSDCQVSVDNNSLARQKDPVFCEVCGAKAANQAFLHAHQTTHSELPRPHLCNEVDCNKHFVFRCQLDRHLLQHQSKNGTNEPESPDLKEKGKFRCSLCNKRSRTRCKLDAHMQTCHKPNAQEYRCGICNICVPSAKQFSSHYAKKHEGVTPPILPAKSLPEAQKEPATKDDCWTLPDATFAPFPASLVRPESIGSSDSVSASDAFSMYFQSLQSLNPMDMDIPIELEGNVKNGNEKILHPLDGNHREIIHQPANLAEFTRSCKDSELEFHTLQTVQNPETSSALLQTIPAAVPSELPLINESESMLVTNVQNLCNLDNSFNDGMISNFIMNETPPVVAPQTSIFTFGANTQAIQTTERKITIQAQVLPIYTPELKYDPKLDFAIKQELEKNTKELQEICDSTSIGFIPVPESAVVRAVTNTVAPERVLKLEPTSENLDKIVQEIMMPTPASAPEATPAPETPTVKIETVTTSDEIKKKLAAKTKKKKLLEEGILVAPAEPIVPVVENKPVRVDCKLCGKFFSSHDMLIKHCQQNCSGRTQPGSDTICQICGEKLGDRKLYLKHKKEEHPDSLLTCSACNKTFFLMQSLARHQKQTCTNRVEYNCRKCKSQHDSLDSLRAHMQSVHPENVVCHICQKVLATSQSLKRHIKSHTKGEVHPDSPSKFDMSETMDSSDGSLKKLSLNQIDMSEDLSLNDLSSWGNSELIENMNIDAESNFEEELMLFSSDTLTCEFCGSTFSTNKLLLKHLSSQHFPNTHWQPQTGRNSPVEESDLTGHSLASVSCNDS